MGEYAKIIAKCASEWDCPDLMESVYKAGGKKIPFDSPSLNWATYGGIPRASMSVFHGYPGGGKTSTAINLCKNAMKLFLSEYSEELHELEQKASAGKKEAKIALSDLKERGPKKVLYIDLEHSFDKKWAKVIGLAVEDIGVMQPPNVKAEAVLQKILELIETGEVGFLVLDSVPSLVTGSELEKKIGERTVASLAGVMTEFCRKVIQLLTRYDCTLLLINQIRVNMNNPYIEQTPGGEAIKFYASLILSFRLGSPVDFLGNEIAMKSENPAGYKITVRLVKQKSAPFDRKKGEYYLLAQSGLRVDFEYGNLAIEKYGIIIKNKAWFTICDPRTKEPLEKDGDIVKVNGQIKVYDYLQANPEYYQTLCEVITEDINNDGLDITSDDTVEDKVFMDE